MKLGTNGLVTFVNAMDVKAAMDVAMDSGDYTFDCSELTQVDSTMVALILHAIRRARTAKQQIRLINEPKGFRELIALYGIEDAFSELNK